MSRREPPESRLREAERRTLELFAASGWTVGRPKAEGRSRPDLLLRCGRYAYAAEIEVASEGRADRLIPLWSQAYLQALRGAPEGHAPLAVVVAPHVPEKAAEQVLRFAREHSRDGAGGVIDFRGLSRFAGPGLGGLEADPVPAASPERRIPDRPVDLFSDLNQWLLKVLLAPEIPEPLLKAPRTRCRNASQLAAAAGVSAMTASRFVRQLQAEGYLHETRGYLNLTRREDLFSRWEAAARRPAAEMPMRFLLRRDPRSALAGLLRAGQGCLGLFAAADALGLGHVAGVPPHIYVRHMQRLGNQWKGVVPVEAGEPPDIIVREPPFPEAVFRAAVAVDGVGVCDVIQVWLDVASHPARGHEQAEFIRHRVLHRVISPAGV